MRYLVIIMLFILIILIPDNSQYFILKSEYNNTILSMLGSNHLKIPLNEGIIKKNMKIGIIDIGFVPITNLNLINLSSSWSDKIGHGTVIAAIIAAEPTNDNNFSGLIPGIPLYIYNLKENYSSQDLIAAINTLVNNNIKVISISNSNKIPNAKLEDVIQDAVKKNVIFIASAGNTSIEEDMFPASFNIEGLISVGSLDEDYNISDFSTYNASIDWFSPGENVVSTGSSPDEVSLYSGTSVAVPFITTIIALTKETYPKFNNIEIIRYLKSHSEEYMAGWKNTNRPVRILKIDSMFKKE